MFDAAVALAAKNPGNICGQETFYEHVHFNFDGNYRLGRAWAEQVASLLPPAIAGQSAGDWPGQAACERRLGLTDWNRALVFQHMSGRLQQPPLNSQLNNAARLKGLENQVDELRPRMTDAAAIADRHQFEEAFANRAR